MNENDPEYKEYLEYLDYVKSQEQSAAPQTSTPKSKMPEEPGLMDKTLSTLQTLAKPLDYLGGITRTVAAGGAQQGANALGRLKAIANGESYAPIDAVSMDDLGEALKGNAPSTATYLDRAGVPQGVTLSDLAPSLYSDTGEGLPLKRGGAFDPSARSVAGFVGDITLDPLTYLGAPAARGALQATRAGKVLDTALHPVEAALKSSGKKIYKSAPTMKAVDALSDQFGKGSVSDELFRNRVTGSGRAIAEKAEGLADDLGTQRNALLKQADEAGAILDMNSAMNPAQEMVGNIRRSKDPALQPLADSLEQRLKEYVELNPHSGKTIQKQVPSGILDDQGQMINKTVEQSIPAHAGVNASTGSGYKSSLYNDIGQSTWDTLRRTPQGDKAAKAMARGLNQEVNAAANRVAPGLGDRIADVNDRWGKLLTTAKTFEKEAVKGEGKNFFTSVDGMIAPFVHHNPGLLASKKAADLAKTNWLRTKLGLGLSDLSNVPQDELLRRLLIESGYPKEGGSQ